ncbi:hypothetical protein ACP3P6_23295 [Enterobacter mori]
MNIHETDDYASVNINQGMTLTEKIIAKSSNRTHVSPGEVLFVNVDVLMSHDPCTPGVASVFKKSLVKKQKSGTRIVLL